MLVHLAVLFGTIEKRKRYRKFFFFLFLFCSIVYWFCTVGHHPLIGHEINLMEYGQCFPQNEIELELNISIRVYYT